MFYVFTIDCFLFLFGKYIFNLVKLYFNFMSAWLALYCHKCRSSSCSVTCYSVGKLLYVRKYNRTVRIIVTPDLSYMEKYQKIWCGTHPNDFPYPYPIKAYIKMENFPINYLYSTPYNCEP